MIDGVERWRSTEATGLAPALAASRTRIGLIAALFTLAGIGWWWTADQMQGMDSGPWTRLGGFGWFLGVWIVMMGAMMLPSVAPTIALYSRLAEGRVKFGSVAFAAGYLLSWAGCGVLAYVVIGVVQGNAGRALSWDRSGRLAAGGMLLIAAIYQLTPLKDACLGKCRSPLGFLLGSWRDGWGGALLVGARNGLWCVGCCWALMASLFALGIMNVGWMAVVAALIAGEKLLPGRRIATYGTAALLFALGVFLLAAPELIPNLTIPGQSTMPSMGMSHGATTGMSAGGS